MSTNPVTSSTSISAEQAQLLIALLRQQMQATALRSLLATNPANDSISANSSDFTSLLLTFLPLAMAKDDLGTNTNNASESGISPTLTVIPGNSLTNVVMGTTLDMTSTDNQRGQQIATIARDLSGVLRGPMNRSYDVQQTPTVARSTWDQPVWGNGNIQCVAFVAGVYNQAGHPLPAAPNAVNFWSAYEQKPGWQEIANGHGWPKPGDIIVMSGGGQGFGHVAIVTDVIPPIGENNGEIHIAQSNSPTAQASLELTSNGTVKSQRGYPILGFIRLAENA
jgi:surface antigen